MPQFRSRAATTRPVGASPALDVTVVRGPARPPGMYGGTHAASAYEMGEQTEMGARSKRRNFGGFCVLVAVAELGVLGLSFTHWYTPSYSLPPGQRLAGQFAATFALLAHPYDQWRIAVPITAGVGALVAVFGALLWRQGQLWAEYHWIVRLFTLGALGLVIAALLDRTPAGGHALSAQALQFLEAAGVHSGFTLTPEAWAALAVASWGVVVSFAGGNGRR